MDKLLRIHDAIVKEYPLTEVIKLVIDFLESTKITGKLHPLGFYSFNLGKLNEKVNVRLHVWESFPKLQDANLLIHNHIFNLKSLVLIGSVVNRTYKLNESDGANGTLYSVEYVSSGSTLSKIKSGYSIDLEEEITIKQGQYYFLNANEFHESIKLDENYAVTLLTTEIVSYEQPLVFGQRDFGDFLHFERETISVNNLNEVFLKFLKEVKKAGILQQG